MTEVLLGIDVETCSEVDIDVGSWPYSCHPSTFVHCAVFGFAYEKGRYERLRWAPGDALPLAVVEHIKSGRPVVAHNAPFEDAIISNILAPKFGWPVVLRDQWIDTMLRAAAANLPLSLEALASILGGAAKKDKEGKKLMKRLAKAPCTPTPEELARLLDYCEQDVVAMLDCHYRIPALSTTERLVVALDREINRRGVCLDKELAGKLRRLAGARKLQLSDDTFAATDGWLDNAAATGELKEWLVEQDVVLKKARRVRKDGTVHFSPTIDKHAVEKLLEDDTLELPVRAALEARIEAGKLTSLAKLERVDDMTQPDGRLRNALRYAKAHPGRWASDGLQLHNLPKDKLGDYRDLVEMMVEAEDIEGLQFVAQRPLEALSQSLRSVVVAAPGHDLIGGDFAAVEARIVAWLAGQDDKVKVFRDYDATAHLPKKDRMQFDPYVLAAKIASSKDRQLGKVMELALGFGMGDLKFATTALGYGVNLPLKEFRRIRLAWREKNSTIVEFWKNLEAAARMAISNPGVKIDVGRIVVHASPTCLFLTLPSGRPIRFWRPRTRVVQKRFQLVDDDGKVTLKDVEVEELQFFTPHGKGMVVEGTYSGKLAENVTQGTARELLAEALLRLDAASYPLVLHVHDSAVAEVPEGTRSVLEFTSLMAAPPTWAHDLPIAVDAYRGKHFRG